MTDDQYTKLHDRILNELMHLIEDCGDPDLYASAIMAIIIEEIGE